MHRPRRIVPELRDFGYGVNRKRVLRLMRETGRLCTVRRRRSRPRTTDSDHDLTVYPDCTRELDLAGPNLLWVGDISYLRLAGGGFVYLASLMDAWSRRVVGWEVLPVLDARLPLRALERALACRTVSAGLVHHSDRGTQYAASEYVARAESAGLVMSMGRRGHPRDNPKAESFFATLKCEHVFRTEYENLADARGQVAAFMAWYNGTRRHSSLGYLSPEDFEAAGDAAPTIDGGARRRDWVQAALTCPQHEDPLEPSGSGVGDMGLGIPCWISQSCGRLPSARPEDRATQGCDPSAEAGDLAEGGPGFTLGPPLSSPVDRPSVGPQSGKPNPGSSS